MHTDGLNIHINNSVTVSHCPSFTICIRCWRYLTTVHCQLHPMLCSYTTKATITTEWYISHHPLLLYTTPRTVHTVRLIIFVGLIFRGLRSWWFCRFIFSWHTYSSYIAKIQWMSPEHKIHKNLNPTEITNHTIYTSMYAIVHMYNEYVSICVIRKLVENVFMHLIVFPVGMLSRNRQLY